MSEPPRTLHVSNPNEAQRAGHGHLQQPEPFSSSAQTSAQSRPPLRAISRRVPPSLRDLAGLEEEPDGVVSQRSRSVEGTTGFYPAEGGFGDASPSLHPYSSNFDVRNIVETGNRGQYLSALEPDTRRGGQRENVPVRRRAQSLTFGIQRTNRPSYSQSLDHHRVWSVAAAQLDTQQRYGLLPQHPLQVPHAHPSAFNHQCMPPETIMPASSTPQALSRPLYYYSNDTAHLQSHHAPPFHHPKLESTNRPIVFSNPPPVHQQIHPPNFASTPLIPIDTQGASRTADEKRRRNAYASARFRARKREREDADSREVDRLKVLLAEAQEDAVFYRSERDALAAAVSGSLRAEKVFPRPNSPWRGREMREDEGKEEVEEGSESRHVRRRLASPAFEK